jgi:hypothetical protein
MEVALYLIVLLPAAAPTAQDGVLQVGGLNT